MQLFAENYDYETDTVSLSLYGETSRNSELIGNLNVPCIIVIIL